MTWFPAAQKRGRILAEQIDAVVLTAALQQYRMTKTSGVQPAAS
jgi:hypothetical protein